MPRTKGSKNKPKEEKVINPVEAEIKAISGEIQPDFTPPKIVDDVPAFVEPEVKKAEPKGCKGCGCPEEMHYGNPNNQYVKWCNVPNCRCGAFK